MAKSFGLSIGFVLALLATAQSSSKDSAFNRCDADDSTCTMVDQVADADASVTSHDDILLLQTAVSQNAQSTGNYGVLNHKTGKNKPEEPHLIPLPDPPVPKAIKDDDVRAKSPPTPGAGKREEEPLELVDTESCGDGVTHFNHINGQATWDPATTNDPYFPPNIYSIGGGPGKTCGDTAAGQAIPCETYDHWKTMQQVATQLGQTFKVFGPSGITFNDIGQGSLGNCYFLAALASVANSDPTIISDMFIEQNLWSQNIFKTKWYINGQHTVISVDNMIPASGHTTYFTKPSATGEFWPVILAKAWAKMSGNFETIEGGNSAEVVGAITRAPSYYWSSTYDPKTEDQLWTQLLDCKTNAYPSSYSIKSDMYGMVDGHAYAILDAYTHSTYGRVVKMYNPWASDNYNGSVPNTAAINGPNNGVFTMTLNEFHTAYYSMDWTLVNPNYEVVYITVPTGSLAGADVTVPSGNKFYVSVTWTNRFLIKPCSQLSPSVFLTASTSTSPVSFPTTSMDRLRNNQPLEIHASKAGGTYHVLARGDFPSSNYVPSTMSLSVYAPAGATITHVTDAGTLALQMYAHGNCPDVTLSGAHSTSHWGVYSLDTTKPSWPGIPSYWTKDAKHVLYVNKNSKTGEWYLLRDTSLWPQCADGSAAYYNGIYTAADFPCGCFDYTPYIPVFNVDIPCTKATDTNYMYSSVKCTGGSHSHYVQDYCPSSCGSCR